MSIDLCSTSWPRDKHVLVLLLKRYPLNPSLLPNRTLIILGWLIWKNPKKFSKDQLVPSVVLFPHFFEAIIWTISQWFVGSKNCFPHLKPFCLAKVSSGRTPRATEPHQLLQRPEGFPDPVVILACRWNNGGVASGDVGWKRKPLKRSWGWVFFFFLCWKLTFWQ